MKDWNTYAVALLAIWCACLTFNSPSSGRADDSVDITDSPPTIDLKGATALWRGGGDLVLDCYCRVAPLVPGSAYSALQRCRLSFHGDGRLASAELLPDITRLATRCNLGAGRNVSAAAAADAAVRERALAEQMRRRAATSSAP